MLQCRIMLFLFAATLALDAGAAVWYVDVDSAAASPDGKTWAKAYRTLQQGIDAASAQSGEVWVAEGIYGESRSAQADGALVLRPSVQVYGGFAGNETSRAQRDWKTRVTVIDGARSRTNNLPAYHVVIGANNARLDGFTIRGGNANGGGVDDPRRFGGGVYNHSASPQLANLVFEGLQAATGGAALYNSGGVPAVSACVFQNNDTAGKGAAVFNTASSATFDDCTFAGNEAGTGGAVHNNGSTPTYRNCVFTNNSATYGGAMSNASSSANVRNCTFEDNSSTRDGGAVYNETASPSFTACAFTSNEAGTGAAANGGAVYNPGSASDFTNCTFLNNSTVTRGGAIYGMTAFSVLNCSFKNNRASSGGTLFNAGGAPKFTNSILWDGQPSEITNSAGTAVVTYSDVEGGYTGTGNINANPSFVNVGTMPLRLKPGSLCINRGTASNAPSTDFAGAGRPLGNFYDMGAFEGASCVLTTTVTGPGTVTPAPGAYHYYLLGAEATLTATPSANCRFVGWSGGASGTQSPLKVAMSADRAVQATFVRQYKLTVQVQGTGTVNPGVGEHTYDSGAQVSLAVTAGAGWRFDHWEGDLTGSASPGSITMTADRSVKAVFVRTYTLTVAIQGSGTTSPAAGTHTYTEGSIVAISATPRAGWRFDRWEGAATGSTNPVSVTLNANRSVTAIFAQVPTYTLTISTGGSGTTNPAAGSYTHAEGSLVSITATPATNWAFDHWEGDVSGSTNPLPLTMSRAWACKAVFVKIPLEVKSLSPTEGLSIGGTALTLSVQSWTADCRVVIGGQTCRILSAVGTGTTQVRAAAPAITPGAHAVVVRNLTTLEEDMAGSTFASIGDPFDARLPGAFDTGLEIDDNDSQVTTYARRVWRGSGAMPAIHYESPQGLVVDVPGAAIPATATGAFLLARTAAQPGQLFTTVTPLPDYRLRSAVADVHIFIQEPAEGGGFAYSRLEAPASGTITITSALSPGPLDPLVAGGFDTDVNAVFAIQPPTPADFAELVTTHTLDAEDRAVFKLAAFGTVALFGDGPYQDINDNGTVDAADIQLVVNAAIGADIGGLNADIDGDAKVNAVDIQLVINAFLGQW